MLQGKSVWMLATMLALASIAGCPTTDENTGGDAADGNGTDVSDSTGGGDNNPIDAEPVPPRDDDGGSSDDNGSADDGSADNDNASGDDGGSTDDGGDDGISNDNSDDGGDSTALLGGTFAGTIVVASIQNVGDTFTDPANENHTVTFQFDDAGIPLAIPILGFVSTPDSIASVNDVGETETIAIALDGGSATLDITVTETTYTASTARIVYDLFYDEVRGSLAQSGPGVQTVEVSVAGDTLTITIATDYDVNITAPLALDTGEQLDSSATLPRQ